MTEERSRNHIWSEADDAKLTEAVQLLGQAAPKRVKFWSAVAGRLLPDIQATADACRCRWERISKAKAENATSQAAEKAWRDLAARVESYEQDQLDYLVESVCGVRDAVNALNNRLSAIEAEQRRLRSLWE